MVEHDESIVQYADKLIALGPGAGKFGGEIVYSGKPEMYKANGDDKSSYIPPDINHNTPEYVDIRHVNIYNIVEQNFRFPKNAIKVPIGFS
ncbi:MAG: hypothetical protein C0594_03625 [Marinilabiliales bacterium]|nr:MAG: hypothetical protein C0594_03625 [Marinilabiliales bacterium]